MIVNISNHDKISSYLPTEDSMFKGWIFNVDEYNVSVKVVLPEVY